MLHHLLKEAQDAGYREIVLETTSNWDDAVQFYLKHGFRITHRASGNTHFALDLNNR